MQYEFNPDAVSDCLDTSSSSDDDQSDDGSDGDSSDGGASDADI